MFISTPQGKTSFKFPPVVVSVRGKGFLAELRILAKKALFLAMLGMGADFARAGQEGQMAAAAKQLEQTRAAMSVSLQQQASHFHKAGGKNAHATSGGFFITDSAFSAPADSAVADCDALSPLKIESLATQAARAESVSPDLIRAVIRQESDGKPCAVSSAGAMGLMQLMPGTAGDLGVVDALDPEANVMGGAKFLRKLLDRYSGDINRALGAYNAGPERVDEAQGVPPFPETMNYVDTIMKALAAPRSAQ